MDKTILLEFDRATTRLAGNQYGRKQFEVQVKERIDYEVLNTIKFPEQIERVASSFTQGFFSAVIEKVGYEKFDEVVKIETKDEKLTNAIRSDLFV